MNHEVLCDSKKFNSMFPDGECHSSQSASSLSAFGPDVGKSFPLSGGMVYGKIFEQTFTGSMMGAGAHVFAVWAYVVANVHFSKIELNPKYLSVVIGESPEKIMSAIDFLCQPDPYSRSSVKEGRRIVREGQFQYHVVNHETYTRIRKAEERREYLSEKQREYRAKESVYKNVDSIQLNTMSTVSTHPDPDPTPDLTLKTTLEPLSASPHSLVISHFKAAFEKFSGTTWHVDGGKIGSLVKKLLKTHKTSERVNELIDKFFGLPSSDFLDEAGRDFRVFYSQVNKLAAKEPARKDPISVDTSGIKWGTAT